MCAKYMGTLDGPVDREVTPDPPLTAEQHALVAKLTSADRRTIDEVLLANATPRWRKVAMIVGMTMIQLEDRGDRVNGIPDVFYSQRVRVLVEAGRLEAAGDLAYMRFSEVRLVSLTPEGGVGPQTQQQVEL